MKDNIIIAVGVTLLFALIVFFGYLISVSGLPDWFKFFLLH
jgi:hypothetical protein